MIGGLIIRPAPHLPPVRVWVRPGRVPSKAAGRKGTRRAWKRKHPPRWVVDPTRSNSVVHDGVLYVDPASYERLRQEMDAAQQLLIVNEPPGSKARRRRQSLGDLADALKALSRSAEDAGVSLSKFGGTFSMSAEPLRGYDLGTPAETLYEVLAPLKGLP